MIKHCVLLTLMYQKEYFASELMSSACSTKKKSSFQICSTLIGWNMNSAVPNRPNLPFLKVQTNWPNQTTGECFHFEFSNPKLVINKPLGVGYYVTFPRMKYDCKKGLVWDLTNKHCDMSLHFEATSCHPSSKTTFSPQISKARSCMHLPWFVSRKIIKSRNRHVQGLNLNCQSQEGMVNSTVFFHCFHTWTTSI